LNQYPLQHFLVVISKLPKCLEKKAASWAYKLLK
jgi:hypothetical protein